MFAFDRVFDLEIAVWKFDCPSVVVVFGTISSCTAMCDPPCGRRIVSVKRRPVELEGLAGKHDVGFGVIDLEPCLCAQ